MSQESTLTRCLPPVLVGVFFLALFFSLTLPVSDPDFWWHLASGRWMWEHKALLHADPFTIPGLAADSFINRFTLKQYWLSQLIFYGAYSAAGFQGAALLTAAVLTGMFAALHLLMRRAGIGRLPSLCLVFAAAMVVAAEFGYVGARPQMWTSLFVVLVILLLEEIRRGTRGTLPLLPLLMLLWSNLHGGYVVGDIIILVYLAESFLTRTGTRPFRIAAVCALLASGANPNGFAAVPVSLLYPLVKPFLAFFDIPALRSLAPVFDTAMETQSVFEHATVGGIVRQLPWFSLLLALSLLSFLPFLGKGRWKDLRPAHLCLYLLVLLLALRSIRYVVFFAGIAPFVVALNLRRLRDLLPPVRRRIPAVVTLLLTVAATGVASARFVATGMRQGSLVRGNSFYSEYAPAIAFMKENGLAGNIFNDYNVGGYLIWEVSPRIRVFIDGRSLSSYAFDVYRSVLDDATAPFRGIRSLPTYTVALNNFDIDLVLIPGCDRVSGTLIQLAPPLIEDPAWALVYADPNALLFLRRTPANRAVIAAHPVPKERAYEQILGIAKRASAGHARIMPNWKLSTAVAYAGLGETAKALPFLDDYLGAVPGDAFALLLRERLAKMEEARHR